MKKFWIIRLAPILVVLGMNSIALATHFYDSHPHFDVIMHLLGGTVIALFWLSWNRDHFPDKKLPTWYLVFVTVSIVALVGVGWEFYEFLLDARDGAPIRQLSIANTMQDLACDLLGGLLVSIITFWRRR
jgi:hypothetical protein